VLLLGACLALLGVPFTAVSGSADTTSALLAQRAALQRQASSLGVSSALAALNEKRAELAQTQAALSGNAAQLRSLQAQMTALQARIAALQTEIDAKKAALAQMTRTEYKRTTQDSGVAMMFGARNFGQFITSWVDTAHVEQNIADLASKLRVEQAQQKTMAADVAAKQDAANLLQAQLERDNGRVLAEVAAADQAYASLSGQAQALAGQMANIDRQIASATVAPARAGGSSCGNHFTPGQCTWYVANRRCIPWYGNADEWFSNARAYGYPEGHAPVVGAVAVWGNSGYSPVGHVAYVESVGSTSFVISEMNYNGGTFRVDYRTIQDSSPGPNFLGFIYGR